MRIVILVIASVLTALFAVLSAKGAKYDYMLEPLDEGNFPLKSLYAAGFALSDARLFRLRGALGKRLREDTNLFYGAKFGEFYARAVWAQCLSLALVCAAAGFALAGLLGGDFMGFLVLLAVVMAGYCVVYFFGHTGQEMKARREECEAEFPNAASKLALLVNAGAILHEAWRMVAYGKEGKIYEMMRAACDAMDNGTSEIDAIYEFGVRSGSKDIKKFASALIQSLERGGGELPALLTEQSSELWAQRRQHLLQKGEAAAGALLAPIGLMFAGTLLLVVAAALQSMSI